MSRRVVVTGVGAVTPLGNDAATTWNNILNGVSGIEEVTLVDKDLVDVHITAEVKGFQPENHMSIKDAKRMGRFTQFAVAASKMALNDAGIIINENAESERVGVWIGSGIGGLGEFEIQHRRFMKKGGRSVSPFTIPMFIPDMASGYVSIETGAKGINNCSVTACASGSNSIGDAFRAIKNGTADVMISGGTEAAITEMTITGFSNMRALSKNPDPKKASRPFDKNRDGFILGEGCGVLILEELEHAKARGAKIYAELAGYGATGDAFHITTPAPEGEGAQRSMEEALLDANVLPEEVDYINAHGTSTYYNDLYETTAIKTVFKDHAYKLAISSTKSMTGHLLGGAGGLEAMISVLAIKDGIMPPTVNYETPDEELDLDYVPNEARKKDLNVVLSNSLGFGGHNATLLFKKYTD